VLGLVLIVHSPVGLASPALLIADPANGGAGTAANAGLTPLVVAGLCYLIITVPLGQLSAYFERRTQLAGRK